jgi:hypothetical protein
MHRIKRVLEPSLGNPKDAPFNDGGIGRRPTTIIASNSHGAEPFARITLKPKN